MELTTGEVWQLAMMFVALVAIIDTHAKLHEDEPFWDAYLDGRSWFLRSHFRRKRR